MHDDFEYLRPVQEEKTGVAPDDEVVDLTGDDDEEQAQQPHDIESTRQAWKQDMMNFFRKLNMNHSSNLLHIPRVFGDPLRFKDNDNQEIHYKSLSKLKT